MTRMLKSPLSKMLSSNALSGLPAQLSARLFAHATPHRLKAGATLFDAGDAGDGCYRLEQGLLKVVVNSPLGEARIICVLGADSIVGELSMIDGLPRSATVIAVRDSALEFISKKAFEQCTTAHPEICTHLMVTLASRLREADEAMAAASFLTVRGRVARALLELAEYLGQESGVGGIMLGHKISQGDLAAMAGVARENVSRTLSEWKQRKIVTKPSLYYCLNDIAALEHEMQFDA